MASTWKKTHCNTLLHTATHWYILQHTATTCNTHCYNTLLHTATHWLFHTATYCNTLHTATTCNTHCTNTLRHTATHTASRTAHRMRGLLFRMSDSHGGPDFKNASATHCNTLQTHCNTVQHTLQIEGGAALWECLCRTVALTFENVYVARWPRNPKMCLQHTATHCNTDAPVALTSKMPSSMVRSDTSNVPPPRSKMSTYLLSFSVFFTFFAGSSAAFAAEKHIRVGCQKVYEHVLALFFRLFHLLAAVCSSVLQCVAVCCSMVQCVALIVAYMLTFPVFFTFLAGSSAVLAAAKHMCVGCQKICQKVVCLLPRVVAYTYW